MSDSLFRVLPLINVSYRSWLIFSLDSYILRQISTHLNTAPEKISAIILHLGSGASICAIKDGKSLDTSMGLTPLDGLPGATRSGHVDPSLIFHYTSDGSDVGRMSQERTEKMHLTEVRLEF